MGKSHLKRLNSPKSWRIKRKGIKFITRPNPGPHQNRLCLPLTIILRDILGYAKTAREVKQILHNKDVLVDGRVRVDGKYPVGFMDVVQIPKLKENYRLLIDTKGSLVLHKIDSKEANIKPCKVMNKTMLKGGKIQLNLSYGVNLNLKKDDFKVGETLLIETPKLEIKEQIKLEKGTYIILMGGKHIGDHGLIENVEDSIITYKSVDGTKYTTMSRFALALGKDKPAISVIG